MFNYSEFDMGIAFEQALRDGNIPFIRNPQAVYKEILSVQGIPDFVIINDKRGLSNLVPSNLSHLGSISRVLANLKPKAGRSRLYLYRKTGLSIFTLNMVLRVLLRNSLIVRRDKMFYLNPEISLERTIWAFELKLEDWKRALFQAMQYRAFANYAVTVFPMEKENLLKANLHMFVGLDIGVLLFDRGKQRAKWLFRPKKQAPISKWQAIYMYLKLRMHSGRGNGLLGNEDSGESG